MIVASLSHSVRLLRALKEALKALRTPPQKKNCIYVKMTYGSMRPKPRHQGGNGKLTQRQKDTLKRHSAHHTQKHMAMMRSLMKQGKTFGEAHKIAMKKIGK